MLENSPWFEIDISKDGTEASRRLAAAFFDDYCLSHRHQGLPVNAVHVRESERLARFLLPPEGVSAYFLSPHRSAMADWLRTTGMARPCPQPPDTLGYRLLPCKEDGEA